MNKVTLIGNVVRDLELKTYNEGKGKYVRFTLAVSNYKRKIKEREASFIVVAAFNKKAEALSKYIGKGSKIVVEGKLQSDNYLNSEGDKCYSITVILEDFHFVDNIKENKGKSVVV